MARLIVRHFSGSRRGAVEIYPLARYSQLRIGRDPSSDICFHPDQDAVVSRHHAMIEWHQNEASGWRFTLNDLLSSNGTLHNGEPVAPGGVELVTGDRVQFGRGGPLLVFEVDSTEASEDGEGVTLAPNRTQEMPAVTVRRRHPLLSGKE
ncbi:MAG: FHA domain-containing protein [Lysobacterales bacterium]